RLLLLTPTPLPGWKSRIPAEPKSVRGDPFFETLLLLTVPVAPSSISIPFWVADGSWWFTCLPSPVTVLPEMVALDPVLAMSIPLFPWVLMLLLVMVAVPVVAGRPDRLLRPTRMAKPSWPPTLNVPCTFWMVLLWMVADPPPSTKTPIDAFDPLPSMTM